MSDHEQDDYDDQNDLEDNSIGDLEDDEDEQEAEIIENDAPADRGKKISNEDRTSVPFLTKYERARILGTRAL